MINECTAIIMAGGQSQRMGCDKAMLVLGEDTLLQRVVSVVQPMFSRVMVSVRQHRSDIDLPQVCDAYPDSGPLAGLCAGLEQSGAPWIFAVATDMPFLQPVLIDFLARQRADHQAVVPVVDGHVQPLAAFYSVSALPVMQGIIMGNGRRSIRSALEQLNVLYVAESELLAADPDLRSFVDLDTPQDLAALQQRTSGRGM